MLKGLKQGKSPKPVAQRGKTDSASAQKYSPSGQEEHPECKLNYHGLDPNANQTISLNNQAFPSLKKKETGSPLTNSSPSLNLPTKTTKGQTIACLTVDAF